MAEFDAILGSLQRRKVGMLRDAADWSAEALVFRAVPQAWCGLDVLDHLARTEFGVSSAMRKGMERAERIPVGDAVRGLVVLAVMYAPTRVKVPAGAEAVLPRTPADLESAAAGWDSAREHLLETVEELRRREVKGGVFRHPVGGWMHAERALRFLDSHVAHHGFQWKRIGRQVLEVRG